MRGDLLLPPHARLERKMRAVTSGAARLGSLATLPLILLVTSCSDQTITIDPAGFPILVITPEAVEVEGVCESRTVEVVLGNHGDELLTIHGVEVVDGDWTVDPDASWPAEVEPGGDVVVTLLARPGEASLVVRSNDPARFTAEIPLSAVGNEAPSLALLQPSDAALLADGEPALLSAQVTDADGPVEGLTVSWSSDVDGPIGTSMVGADGAAEYSWDPDGRTPGFHVITASVEDVCGNEAGADVPVCQDGLTPSTASDYVVWQYERFAYWDIPNDWIQLTDPAIFQSGSAIDPVTRLRGAPARVDFDFFSGDGSGGDGFAVVYMNASQATSWLGGAGGCLGYASSADCPNDGGALPGWAMEFDYQNNPWDPVNGPHVEFVLDGNLAGPNVYGRILDYHNTGWHRASVMVSPTNVQVDIDGQTYLIRPINESYDFDYDALLTFTAATGYQNNAHRIRNITPYVSVCLPP